LALTGTPIKNGRPINLFPLLKATNHELAKNKRDFESYFCAAKVTRFCPWDVSGAAHLDELHARTKNVMFRRTKAQCLDLPEKTRMMRSAEVTGDALKTWKQSFLDAQLEYEQNQGMGKGEALVLLGKLRKAASVAKIETAIEMATDILEEGQQVVIFTEFLDTAKELNKHLGGELLIGETAVGDRQNLVDRFQSGQSKVFISTSRAGGVGITLTAAQTVIMVDRPWTSGDAMQCEDRCHRIGQKNSVSVYWLQWHEIDQKIDSILEQKQERIELILEGKRKTLRGIGSPADIAQELCEDILKSSKKVKA
jgi:SNF2 family DNA or RNA helicase